MQSVAIRPVDLEGKKIIFPKGKKKEIEKEKIREFVGIPPVVLRARSDEMGLIEGQCLALPVPAIIITHTHTRTYTAKARKKEKRDHVVLIWRDQEKERKKEKK